MSDLRLEHAYAIFCDANNLPRIDATYRDELSNLNKMASAIHKRMVETSRKIVITPAELIAESPLP